MRPPTRAALLGFSLVFLAPVASQAGTRVVVDFGGIAFGYEDGYWDRDHRWHDWDRREDWDRYRQEQREHAYAWRHDRDRDMGWHDAYWHHDSGRHNGWYKHHDRDDDGDHGHDHHHRD
jgi:hypothetical protein